MAGKLNQLRIIGGRWRGRKIDVVPDVESLRPTHDRVRETVFNWLAPYINGALCLDLYAGSGALGFEALSRGANAVAMVDSHNSAIAFLKNNASRLRATNCFIKQGDCSKRVDALPFETFDIVFIDPPYRQGLISPTVLWLDACQMVKPGGWVYVETERDLALNNLPASWHEHRHKHTRSLDYYLFQYAPDS